MNKPGKAALKILTEIVVGLDPQAEKAALKIGATMAELFDHLNAEPVNRQKRYFNEGLLSEATLFFATDYQVILPS